MALGSGRGRLSAATVALTLLGLALPAGAAAFPPVRVIAGERSVEAVTASSCEPPSGGRPGSCQAASFAAGPGFPPALPASPGSEVVVDTGAVATAVGVSVSRFRGGGESTALSVRRIDSRRWAVAMPRSNVTASIGVTYPGGGTTDSFLVLRRIVATSDGLTSVDAHGEVVAWSERTAAAGSSPASYQLTALVDGELRRVPVAPRSVAFDVDLGPDRRGRTVAVYSRCAQEPELPAAGSSRSGPAPPYTRGRGCDLYRFDFVSGRERKLPGASTDQASEMLPSIWRDEIAFARVYEKRSGLRGRAPYLYVRPVQGGESRRQPGGSRGSSGLPGPLSVDLYGRRLSFVWNYATADAQVSELRLDTLRGAHSVLDRTRRSGATFLSPQGTDGRVFYGARSIAAEGSKGRVDRLLRRRLSTDTLRVAGAPERPTGVGVTGAGALFAASRDDDGGTAIIDVSDAGFFAQR